MTFDPELRAQLSTQLQQILTALPLTLPDSVQEKIIVYLELLSRWNRAYNLTAITEPTEMIVKHIADSLTVAPFLIAVFCEQNLTEMPIPSFLDVGTGAGLPGIPLALAFPKMHWTLLDSNGKKTRFLQQVKAVLDLNNVEIIQTRVEQFVPEQLFDGVIARAWATLPEMLEKTQHLYAATGKLWAMKGTCPTIELEQLKLPYHVHRLNVPGLADARHLIIVEP